MAFSNFSLHAWACTLPLGWLLVTSAPGAAPTIEIAELPGGRVQLTAPAPQPGFVLEESAALGPAASWSPVPGAPATSGGPWAVSVASLGQPRFFRLALVSTAPAQIVGTSPAAGETGVSVHRETVFRFDAPLAADTVLDTSIVSAHAAGRPQLTRVELATDRRAAVLFYLEPLPPGTRVTARLNGFAVLDASGRALDADADGLPGGVREVTFTTANATAIGDTAVRGRVLDSEKNPDGTDRPLPGVTITVDGAEQTLRAVTGPDGSFVLQPAPAGRFFVHVDGRTSPLSQWPDGAYYPFVGKAWIAEPGRTNNLANGDGRIFLPRVAAEALRPVSATEPTVVTFPPSVTATQPALAGVELRVPPNALFADDGARGGQVGLAPVAPDRLPEPLPPGLNLPLVITIQTDGPLNFDRPVPVRFPNLPDPVTGVRLPPGAKTALWSFDHDTGRWEIAGPMTVTADGQFAETDPGVGVRQPGWHGAAPGSAGGGPDGDGDGPGPDDCPTCDDDKPKDKPDCNFFDPFCSDNPCDKEAKLLANSVLDLAGDLALAHVGKDGPSCLMGGVIAGGRAARDCTIDPEGCTKFSIFNPIIDGAAGTALGCIPKVGAIVGAGWTFKSVIFNVAALKECIGRQTPSVARHGATVGAGAPSNDLVARLEALLDRQLEVAEASSNLVAAWFGPAWAVAQTPQDTDTYTAFMAALQGAVHPESAGGTTLTPEERTHLLAQPLPASVTRGDLDALIARFDLMASDAFRPGQPEADAFLAAYDRLATVLAAREAEGWETVWDGLHRVAAVVSAFAEPAAGSAAYPAWTPPAGSAALHAAGPSTSAPDPAFPLRAHHFTLVDLASDFVQRGRLTDLGQFDPLILAPDRRYQLLYLDPVTGRVGTALFRSAPAGRRTRLPAAPLLPDLGPDADADGLGDRAEFVLGTHPAHPDTDGDGVSDGAEFRAGDHPLGPEARAFGVVGGADTPGAARDLAIEGDLVVVLDDPQGLALFDIANPTSPVRLTQFPLTRPVSVALSGGLALVGQNNGATLLDLRQPDSPQILTNFPGAAAQTVAIASPYGYLSRATNVLTVDLATGTLLPAVGLPAAVDDLAVDGDLLHVLTRQALHLFRRRNDALLELSRIPVAGDPAPLEAGRKLFAGGGRAYVGYFRGYSILDVSDPTAPVVLATQPVTQAAIHDFADNGSGRLAAITSFGGQASLAFSLYDVAAGTSTTNFLTSLATPGDPFAVVLHRGLAYVADDEAGLQVLHYLPRDTAGQRPAIAFGPPLSLTPELEAGSNPLLTFTTGDDVGVREVELFADGLRVAAAGSFPFQIPVAVTPPAPGQTRVVLRARAIDTAGNERWTDDLSVTITPDRTAPTVRLLRPSAGSQTQPGQLAFVTVGFSEPMDPTSLAAGLRLTEAGPDGALGTADDVAIEALPEYDDTTRTARLRRDPAFASGRYRLAATSGLRDASGIALATARTWEFRVLAPDVVGFTPANNSNHRPGGPTPITARFSTLMDAAALRAGGFRLLHAGPDGQRGTPDDEPVDVSTLTFTSISNRMVFAPAPPLRSGRYRATITPGALDTLGNGIAAAESWDFSVLSPSVTAVDPPDGHARPLDSLTELQIRVTDPLHPATLPGGLQLTLTNGAPVSGGIPRFDPDTLTATLAFPTPLAGGEYQLRVTTNVTDVFGNPLAAPFTSRFGVHGPVRWAIDADGRWDTAANWSPARPVPGDDVRLDRPTADVVVTHQTGTTLVHSLEGTESLRLIGGSLTLQASSRLAGPLLIQSATLSNRAELHLTGPVTLGPRAVLRGEGTTHFSGGVTLQGGPLADRIQVGPQTLLVAAGTLSWTAGNLDGDGSGRGATWILGPDATLDAIAGTGARDWQGHNGTFWNRGLFRHRGSTNRLRWYFQAVTNDALWELASGHAELQGSLVQSGRLTLASGTSFTLAGNDGVLDLAPGAAIEGAGAFSASRKATTLAGRFAVAGGASFNSLSARITGELAPGAGGLRFANCDVDFDNGPLTLLPPLNLRGGTLAFRHPTTLGAFRWEFGTVAPTRDLIVNNPLILGVDDVANGARLEGPGILRLAQGFEQRASFFELGTNAVLEHAGTTVWAPRVVRAVTTLELGPGAVFRNLPGARFELATNGTLSGPGLLENLGTLAKAANRLTNRLDVAFDSPGTLTVAGGVLQLAGGGTLAGPVEIAAGASLEVTGANRRPGWQFNGPVTGAGQWRVRGGSNQLNGPLAGPSVHLDGGDLRLPANLSLTNAEIRGGTLHLDGPLRLAGTASILTGSSTRIRGTGPVRNDGALTESVVWFDTDIENAGEWTYAAALRPRYAGTFRNLAGATYTLATNLTGTLNSNPDPGAFDNAGLLRQAGTGTSRLSVNLTNRGLIELTGTLILDGAFTQTDEGLTRLAGGTLSPGNRRALAGEIHGPGTLGRTSGSDFYVITNTAHLRPGGPSGFGVLTFHATAAYLWPASRLTVRVGGPTAGIDHDQLRGSHALWLGGRLRLEFVPGFTPAVGQRFLIVSAGSRNQTFQSPVEITGLPAGLGVRLQYLTNGVEAEITTDPSAD